MQNSFKMVTKREVTTDEWRGRYLIDTNYSTAAVSENEAKWRGRKGADITVIITSEWHWPLTGTYPWEEIRQVVMVFLPDDVALEGTILMALRGWLPLDHDGLIGAATCDDCLRGGAGRLFRES